MNMVIIALPKPGPKLTGEMVSKPESKNFRQQNE